MGAFGKIIGGALVFCCWWKAATAEPTVHAYRPVAVDTVPVVRDTPVVKTTWWKRNMQELKNKRYRDSLLSRLSRENATPPGDDSSMQKSEHVFLPQQGRHIRRIYFRRVQVFGPNDIYDTTFQSSNKLLRLANNMHYDSRQWVIKQSMFFHPGDTVNAYEFADNERYLRNLPFIQDARIYLTNASSTSDSVDVNVVTKDVFEYGGDLGELSNTNAKFDIYNNDLFGAGQSLAFGFLWDQTFSPRVATQAQFAKSNIGGSFINGAVGYTYLNNNGPLDTNTYEGSYYIALTRPLYRSVTPVIGGLSLARNFSMNIHNLGDSLYRNYEYNIVDAWVGYNCSPGVHRSTGSEARGPSLAILLRHYNLYFTQYPIPQYKADPVYNNRRYVLGEFALYRQDFFKAHYFFGFGRTEDIPLGYNVGLYGGEETWVQRQRSYTGLNLQKYWVTPLKGLLNTQVGLSSFWHPGSGSEDAVIHGEIDYYSRLVTFPWSKFRQFFTIDYLDCPNPFFYKPLNINNQFGIYGINNTQINGFQRMNVRAQSNFYTPLKFYGFKFNLQATVQTSQLAYKDENLFENRMYAGFGLGCEIRNENLTFNTLKIDGNYYPYVPPGMRGNFFFEITTVSDFRFNIFALNAPSYLNYR